MAKRHRGQLIFGVILILFGGLFLLRNLGVDLPDLGDLWPLFLIVVGLMMILSYLPKRQGDSGVLIPGCGAFLTGLFFLAITAGPLRWHDLDAWWPVFPLIGGVAFLATFAFSRQRDAGLLIPGLGGALTGAFFFLLTLGPLRWRDLPDLWPAFPLIFGLTFLGAWLAHRRDRGLLVPAFLGIGAGAVGFLFTYRLLELEWLARGWPLLLVVLGLALIVRALSGRRGGP